MAQNRRQNFHLDLPFLHGPTMTETGGDPWSLFLEGIPAVSNLVGADNVFAEFWKREPRLFRKPKDVKTGERNWIDLTKQGKLKLIEDERFPEKFRFEKNGRIILLAETENWCLVGGPAPYHDSTTVSFFSSEDLSVKLKKVFIEVALHQDIEILSQQ